VGIRIAQALVVLITFPIATPAPQASGLRPRGSVLDEQAVLSRQSWWDNRDFTWYKKHIPFFESPDADIDATYYYRWELVTKHLTYGSQQSGYSFTEFIDRPFWSGAFGAISCPLGHQMYEIRWLKDSPAVEDFARYWFETPGAQPRSYSNWYGDAVWATYLVTADRHYLRTMLPHMEAQYAGWMAEHWDSTHKMFRWDGLHDGMEVNINSRLTTDPGSGAEGYRPTLNSYLFADARAIAQAAALFGDSAKARDYAERAADLKRRVQQELWDPGREFFFHQFANDEKDGIKAGTLTYRTGPFAGNSHGREEIGFVPWQFNLPDAGHESAWRFLMDTAYFFSTRGPTTVERHDPQFQISPRCCVWSGNEWPYATTQTLVAMANLLNNYKQSVVTAADYARLFKVYTLDQRMNGRPYIAEAANPDNGSWDGHNTFDHSEHYFHSGYVDLVITGIAGLRPRADDSLEVNPLAPADWAYFALDDVRYHGHDIAIVWDRDGTRYHVGAGLWLFSDGRTIGHAAALGRLSAYLGPTPTIAAPDRPENLAVNNGHAPYPLVTTSYSAPGTSPHYLNDGNYWYGASPPNRWTTAGSPHRSDWVTVDFFHSQAVESVALYFLDDSTGVRPPARYDVEMWRNGGWVTIPGQRRTPTMPAGRMANTVSFPTVETGRLRIVLTPRPSASTGLTEIEAWRHPLTRGDIVVFPPANLAWGAQASASFTSKYDHVDEINDMVVAFSRYSRNRWTAFGSPNASDWVQLDFPGRRRVDRVELYLWGDGDGVKAPKRYTIQTWSGSRWIDARVISQVPVQPQVSSVNTVQIALVTTDRVRVVFQHDLPAATGLTEMMIRGGR
jgi:Trehalase